jgi:hypothetical protein
MVSGTAHRKTSHRPVDTHRPSYVSQVRGTNEGEAAIPWTQEVAAIMSVEDVAAILPVTAETVCAYIRCGELAASGLGTDKRGRPCPPYAILAEDLFELLRQRRLRLGKRSQTQDSIVNELGRPRRRQPPAARRKLVEPRRPR